MNPALPVTLFDRPLPEGYRDELQALVAERPADPARQAGSMLLFQIGGLRLALPTRLASAVAPVLHIARIPHRSGTVLLGLAAFRGEILPCCSLARLLDTPETQTSTPRTLILEESPGRLWAVPIDAVLGVRLAGAASAERAPIAAQWVKESFADEGGAYHLLDHEVLFRQIGLATA
ncbi:chemotaxis-related protein WspD [Granulicella rosea]|uniref:Chemotaxis-related protein WspD n=1 Tax=Granulicella rosea TaxID=474952 RepID=A0A239K8V2_9BACT|nr:chemotaxis protein CheW [Granulicella rosea]SNT14807.1 chemotaxis-related protein WspD [Granulicella rosea]